MSKEIAHSLSGKRMAWLVSILAAVAMLGTLGANWLTEDAKADLPNTTAVLTQSPSAGTVNPGAAVTYTLTVTTTADFATTNHLSLNLPVPAGLVVTGGSCNAGMVFGDGSGFQNALPPGVAWCHLTAPAPAGTYTLTLTGTAPASGSVAAPSGAMACEDTTEDLSCPNEADPNDVRAATNGAGVGALTVNSGMVFGAPVPAATVLIGQTIGVTASAVGPSDICSVTEANALVADTIGAVGNGVNLVAISMTAAVATNTTLSGTWDLDGQCGQTDFGPVPSGVTYAWQNLAQALPGLTIRHRDVDAAAEGNGGILGASVRHDNDDATGSYHSACIIGGGTLLTAANNADIDWDIVTSWGTPTVHNLAKVAGPNNVPCVQWISAQVGAQTVTATYAPTGEQIFFDGIAGSLPLIKEWNTIDYTEILDTAGVNVDGKTIDVTGMLITVGPAESHVLAPSKTFTEKVYGSHQNGVGDPNAFNGPIDGVEQTYAVSGNCGSISFTDPVTGAAVELSAGDAAYVVTASSQKGTTFQVHPTDDGAAADGPGDPDLDCHNGDVTIVRIRSLERIQLRSDRDSAPDEVVTIRWNVPPPTNKQPILAWAGQRVVLEHDWGYTLKDGGNIYFYCPFADERWGHGDRILTREDVAQFQDIVVDGLYVGPAVKYVKQAQGPGSFSTSWELTLDFHPDEVIVPVAHDCVSRAMYESQDPGEVDVSAFGGFYANLGNVIEFEHWVTQEVDFLIYYMKLESLTTGIVQGARKAHNSGDFVAASGVHPFDASKDTLTVTSNVSADVLVRTRVKGWFLTENLTGRAAGVDSNGLVLPAGRWVMPDDWRQLAGGALADSLRPNYDIMIDPRTTADANADGTLDYSCGAAGLVCGSKDGTQGGTVKSPQHAMDIVSVVAGPFSLIDKPTSGTGKALLTGPNGGVVGWRETWLRDGTINETDAPMPPALVTFNRSGAGELKAADKFGIYKTNPFYVTHIPAEPWIAPFTADGQGYRWDTWGTDGPYVFWASWLPGSTTSKAMVYTDNHGEAMVYVNGDLNLTFDECSDAASLAANGIVSLAGEYCERGDKVGATTISATADYPDKRKHTPISSNSVSITWTWGGYKVVTVEPGENVQFKYVVIHVKDRDGYCASSPSKWPVLGEHIRFSLDLIGNGRIVGVSSPGEIGLLGQDADAWLFSAKNADGTANAQAIAPIEADECQAWVKISNSLLTETDILITAHDPEGTPVFDRVIDFTNTATLTLKFRWTLVTWPGEDNIGVGAAIASIVSRVTAVYGWDADAQKWLAYFPDGVSVPGANDLSTLKTGVAYWIAITSGADVTWTVATNVD